MAIFETKLFKFNKKKSNRKLKKQYQDPKPLKNPFRKFLKLKISNLTKKKSGRELKNEYEALKQLRVLRSQSTESDIEIHLPAEFANKNVSDSKSVFCPIGSLLLKQNSQNFKINLFTDEEAAKAVFYFKSPNEATLRIGNVEIPLSPALARTLIIQWDIKSQETIQISPKNRHKSPLISTTAIQGTEYLYKYFTYLIINCFSSII